MPKTTSLAFPQMFNVVQNKVEVLKDEVSIANRCRLLILTEPTEIYNEPNQGVGLKRHLWHYNNENEKSVLKNRIIDQLRIHEPYCNPDHTKFADGNLFTGSKTSEYSQNYNSLELTVGVETVFGATVEIEA